jgi:hypothetical protein
MQTVGRGLAVRSDLIVRLASHDLDLAIDQSGAPNRLVGSWMR